MTHLILMVKGPDATEFIEKDEENSVDGERKEIQNFGNIVTRLEY